MPSLRSLESLRNGQRYIYRPTGAIVRVQEVTPDSVFWIAQDDYRVEGFQFGRMVPEEFLEHFDLIGNNYHLTNRRTGTDD